ncbi:ACT domain-containing protein ACR8 [Trifolium repens]|nr:ACT domain-containing protein ACR8 [Trifolium repens]
MQNNGKTNHRNGFTALELKRTDRVGLLSEMFAVLAELQCDVVEAKVWIHSGRIASLIYVKDCNIGTSIEDYQKINRLEARLRYVLQGDSDVRAKLLFDVVCNLTDMEYVVFHATINTRIDQAYLEFYKRHKDGTPISSEPERQHVIQQGVLERRSCVGVRLELSTEDRQGLLAEVVRTFRENGLNVTMADIATRGDLAANTVYVTDAIGYLLGLLTGFFIDSSDGDGVTHVRAEVRIGILDSMDKNRTIIR